MMLKAVGLDMTPLSDATAAPTLLRNAYTAPVHLVQAKREFKKWPAWMPMTAAMVDGQPLRDRHFHTCLF